MHLFIELSNMAFPLQLLTSTPWHTVKVRYNITTVLEIWKKRRKQDPSKLSSVEKVLKALIKYFVDIILPKIQNFKLDDDSPLVR